MHQHESIDFKCMTHYEKYSVTQKVQVMGWRKSSMLKRTRCSFRGLALTCQHPCHLTHTCRQLQFQGTSSPLSSMGTEIHMVPQNSHRHTCMHISIKWINASKRHVIWSYTSFLKFLSIILMWTKIHI